MAESGVPPLPGGLLAATAWAVLLVLAVVVLKALAFLFVPLAVALLCCYGLALPLEFLQRLRVPTALRSVAVVLGVVAACYLLGRLVQANVVELEARLPRFEATFWQYAALLLDRLDISREQAAQAAAAFMEKFKHADLQPLGGVVRQVGGSFFAFLGNIFWVLLFLVFILAERESLARRLARGLGEEQAVAWLATAARINGAVRHYLELKILLSLATGGLFAIALLLFGVPFALLWGVLAFLLNFIPNLGSVIATLPPVAVALFQSGSLAETLLVAAVLVGIQMVVGNVVEPRLMGRGLNLSPLVVLLALLFWGWLWGLVGMLIAVPLTAAIKIACEQFEATRPAAILMSSD